MSYKAAKFLQVVLVCNLAFARQVYVSTASELMDATKNAVAGDTIQVAPGEYSGDLTNSGDPGNLPNGTGYFWIGTDGTAENPIVVVGSDLENPPTLMGSSIDEGYVFHVTGDYVVLKNLILTRGDKGVIFDNANYGILEDCEIHNAGSELVHIRDGSSNCIISRNVMYNSGNGGNGSIGEGLYIGTDQARWGADDRPQSEWGDKAISEGYGGYDWRVHNTKVMYNYFKGSISAELMDVKEGTQNTYVEGNMYVGDSIGKKAGAQYYDDSFIDQKGVTGIYKKNSFFQGGNTLTKYISEVTRNSYAHVPANLTADDHAVSGWCDESANDGNEGWDWENEVVDAAVDPRPNSTVEYFELFGDAIGNITIPENRLSTWERASITFPDAGWDTVDVSTIGIVPNNSLSDSIAMKFMKALESKGTGNVVYFFPEGTYNFEQPILVGVDGVKESWNAYGVMANNFVIAGAGPNKTKFLFDCDVNYFKGLIWIENSAGYAARDKAREITSVPKQGSSTLALQYTWDLSVGDMISVKSDNDPNLMFPETDKNEAWYQKYVDGGYESEFAESFGQIVRVEEILAGNQIRVHPPIGLDFTDSLLPRASIYLAKSRSENIGIEGIYIEHVIDDASYTAGGINDIFDIAIRFAKNIYVKNVESYNTARGHVIVEYAHNVLVSDSKFGYARNYGVGGAGYGVCIQNRSSVVTVENNEFEHLRHAVVLKEGANHCVIGYNYSHDWAILDPAVGVSAEADLSIHGMYSHNNLFEGNVCHNIYYADYWGPTGPRTTAFRNRTFGNDPLEGIYVDDFSHYSNVIANIIPGKASLGIDGTSDSLLLEGNVIGGVTEWNTLSEQSELPHSLYLNEKPAFWIDQLVWPSFGPDVPGASSNQIPASFGKDEVKVTWKKTQKHTPVAVRVLGNTLVIAGMDKTERTVAFFSLNGRMLHTASAIGGRVPLPRSLSKGVYLVQISDESLQVQAKIVVE